MGLGMERFSRWTLVRNSTRHSDRPRQWLRKCGLIIEVRFCKRKCSFGSQGGLEFASFCDYHAQRQATSDTKATVSNNSNAAAVPMLDGLASAVVEVVVLC